MIEPIYEYVKGEGWIVQIGPRDFPWNDFRMKCLACGFTAGKHSASEPHQCPDNEYGDHGRIEGSFWR